MLNQDTFELQLESCHARALQCFCTHFARPLSFVHHESKPTPDTPLTSLQVIRSKWTHFHAYRKPAPTTTKNIFKAWWNMTQFGLRCKQHARLVHSNKMQRIAEVIETAAKAAAHHDSYTLFACIRTLMPKVDRKIKLRNDQGQLMSTVEEVACFRAHIRKTWQGPNRCPSYGWMTTMPFGKEELISALAKTPETKAVAPGRAPGTVWRLHSERVGSWFFDLLCHWWIDRPPVIPQSWKDGWLRYVPKPGKAPSHPSMLRPLALTDPFGKVAMQLVALRVRTQAWSHLVEWPQYAYLPLLTRSHVRRSIVVTLESYAACRNSLNMTGPVGSAVLSFVGRSKFFLMWIKPSILPPEISSFTAWLNVVFRRVLPLFLVNGTHIPDIITLILAPRFVNRVEKGSDKAARGPPRCGLCSWLVFWGACLKLFPNNGFRNVSTSLLMTCKGGARLVMSKHLDFACGIWDTSSTVLRSLV